MNVILNVKDYTKDPYGRYRTDGEGNGEEYRVDYILPELEKGNSLTIDLDGIHGEYGSSFIVEAFANLIRKEGYSYEYISEHITFISNDAEWVSEVKYYLNEVRLETQGHSITNHD